MRMWTWIGRSPASAIPMAAPVIASSDRGVPKTRSGPCRSTRPSVVQEFVSEILAWWPVAAIIGFSAIVTIVTGWHAFTEKVGQTLHAPPTGTGQVPASVSVVQPAPVVETRDVSRDRAKTGS